VNSRSGAYQTALRPAGDSMYILLKPSKKLINCLSQIIQVQWRRQDFQFGGWAQAPKARGSRRRRRGAETKRRRRWGREEWGGDFLLSRLRGLGERRKAPPLGSETDPRPKTISMLSGRNRTPWIWLNPWPWNFKAKDL